jgi:hypothetical protein
MGFKKNDLVFLNEFGLKELYRENSPSAKKMRTILFKVRIETIETRISVNTMNEKEIPGAFPANYFRLPTEAEIKIYKLKNMF